MIYLAYLALLFAYILLAGVALAACGKEPSDCTLPELPCPKCESVGDDRVRLDHAAMPPNGPNCHCQLVDHDVCGLTRHETRLYDDDVYQIVVWDIMGHEYPFIFTLDRTAGVLLTAASFAKNNEFGFNTRSLLTVALGIDLLLKQRK